MVELIGYMKARLDADEQKLRQVINEPGSDPDSWEFDPDWMLADVAAKREILELHLPLWPNDVEPCCSSCGDPTGLEYRAPWPCPTVLAVARPYIAPTPAGQR